MENTNIENKANFKFAAINKQIENLIPKNVEIDSKNKWVQWGANDGYPDFLYDLYSNVPTLSTIINGTSNFIIGNSIKCNVGFQYPNPQQSWEDLIQLLATDYQVFGLCYLQVVRNKIGNPTEFYWLDARYVRQDKYGEVYWYNEDFGKQYTRSTKTLIFPKFVKDAYDIPASVVCIKTPQSRGSYGMSQWEPAIKSVMVDKSIATFHLSELQNNFAASCIINFNGGTVDDEMADEIEKSVSEKFVGESNAARFLLSFNNSKDNATTIERLNTDDFDSRYESLEKSTEQRIFVAFGCSPCIFGLPLDNIGFSQQEYIEAFKIFNRGMVRPIQKRLIDAFDRIFGVQGSISITPFTLEENDTQTEDTIVS